MKQAPVNIKNKRATFDYEWVKQALWIPSVTLPMASCG